MSECAHLVIKDQWHLLTGVARTMRGDAYCVRCGSPVPYRMRGTGPAQYVPVPPAPSNVSVHG